MDRRADIELITKELRRPGLSPANRDKLQRKLHAIQNENTKVRSMRQALIKAHQEGNNEEINDIRHWAESHANYRND
jgi:hypothetical protein